MHIVMAFNTVWRNIDFPKFRQTIYLHVWDRKMDFTVRTFLDNNKIEAVISPRNAGKFLL
jgi:hypothetical protein